ncbi:MAG: M61 family metallopeptidase [Myxococcales bacterium]|nr:M61 family metallopeptidase [Myxococcales bacterium]
MRLLPPAALLVALALLAPPARAEEPLVQYTLRFPEAANHYVDVEAVIPTTDNGRVELMLPVWTPGSYLVRNYTRHLEGFTVDGGTASRIGTNRWQVDVTAPTLRVRYRLYGRQLSVRTNFVERDFALIIGAATFVTRADLLASPHEVRLERPKAWPHVATALPQAGPDRFLAPDYDTLVDAPLLLGSLKRAWFKVDDVEHVIATLNAGDHWDPRRAAADVEKIVRVQRDFWGRLPYPRYHILNLLTGGGGGLEHRESMVVMGDRMAQRDADDWQNWLRLVSHELFHAWNVKRLRPAELGPFDYDQAVYTRSLWIAEGITSYYDLLLVRRAGLADDDDLLAGLSKKIKSLETTPGREIRSLEDASYEAWIKHYMPDENQVNSTISYYTKGAVVAFLLDARLREATGGQKSLDDLLRLAYDRFAESGYTPEQFQALASEVAGADLATFFDGYVRGVSELDYQPALRWFGLRFKAAPIADGDAPTGAWLGARFTPDAHALRVREVPRGTPAFRAGLNAEDELLAVGDQRVSPKTLDDLLARLRPGERATLLVARRDQLLRLPVSLGEEPADAWKLSVDPKATPAQKARLAAWLGAAPP